jgi:hypothetical protein
LNVTLSNVGTEFWYMINDMPWWMLLTWFGVLLMIFIVRVKSSSVNIPRYYTNDGI